MKWIKYIEYLMLAICVAVLVLVFVQGEAAVGLMLNVMYVFFGLAIVLAVLFPLIGMFTNPKGALKTLIALVIVAALVFLCYSLASTEPVTLSDGTVYDSALGLKVTDTGIYIAALALVGGVLAIIVGGIRNAFSK